MTGSKLILVIIGLITVITFYTLHRNGAHISQPPGTLKRLAVFFTVNSAATSDKPDFTELRTPQFSLSVEDLYKRVLTTGGTLGWGILDNDRESYNVSFTVRSPVFMLIDDVYVEVKAIAENRSALYILSSSRSGKADFAANSGHIQELIRTLYADLRKQKK